MDYQSNHHRSGRPASYGALPLLRTRRQIIFSIRGMNSKKDHAVQRCPLDGRSRCFAVTARLTISTGRRIISGFLGKTQFAGSIEKD